MKSFESWVCLLSKFIAICLALAVMPLSAIEPLSEDDLSQVTAQDGVALEIDFRANMEPDPLALPGDWGFRPVAAAPFNSCSGAGNHCSMAVNFANRPTAWVHIKDYYGSIEISDMLLDVGELITGAGGTGFQGDMSQFEDPGGVCLLNGAPGGCNPGDLDGEPALQISFPATRTRTDYIDMVVLQNMGRVAAEYDSGGTPGYLRDVQTGSVLGFRLADNDGGPAGQRLEGRALIFGF